MFLTDEEKKMYQGEYGPGIQKSISLLINFGELFGSEKLIKVNGCHISPDIPDSLLEEYTESVEKVKCNICSIHPTLYPEMAEKIIGRNLTDKDCMADSYVMLDKNIYYRRMNKLTSLGFIPTSTCVPYLVGLLERYKDIFILTGSSGQVICNSLFGGRANREGHSSALASAIIGRTPYWGLLKEENRFAEIVIRVNNLKLSKFSISDYGALGYHIGSIAGTKNVVIDGLPRDMNLEQLKYLFSPMPVSGGTVMCHIVGVTPEAPTLEKSLGGNLSIDAIDVNQNDIQNIYVKLNTAKSNFPDLVLLGCPHLTITEIKDIALFLSGKTIRDSVRLIIGTAKPIYTLAKDSGLVDIIEKAGGEFLDICLATGNPLIYLSNIKVVMSDSPRAIHYIQHLSKGKVQTMFADTNACLKATVSARRW